MMTHLGLLAITTENSAIHVPKQDQPEWKNVSEEGKDLIKKLLTMEPQLRITGM
jgi:hypothetical protein